MHKPHSTRKGEEKEESYTDVSDVSGECVKKRQAFNG